MTTTTTITIDATKRGGPAIWERGGGMSSGGNATIIAAPDGTAIRPVYIRTRGDLACREHALIPVRAGCHIIHGSRGRNGNGVHIQRILSVSVKDIDGERWEATAQVETINTYSRGEWDNNPDPSLSDAIKAAIAKAGMYHCRIAMYVDLDETPAPTPDQLARRTARNAAQDATRAQLRADKAARDAANLAAAEAASIAARAKCVDKIAEIEARFDALPDGYRPTFGPVRVLIGWRREHYYPEGLVEAARQADYREAIAEKNRIREQLLPEFEALRPRVEALGQTLELGKDRAVIAPNVGSDEYTQRGLDQLRGFLTIFERQATEAAALESAKADKSARDAEGAAAGLPTSMRIWHRTGGNNDRGSGWVITPDGSCRSEDRMVDKTGRIRTGDGYRVWDQIRPGEVVLAWCKATRGDEHVFEVRHTPDALTDAQLDRIAQIQTDLDSHHAHRGGPEVGHGWGLIPDAPDTPEEPQDLETSLAALAAKFGRH